MAKLYGVYDTKNNEVCVGILTAREITEMLHITKDGIYKALRRESLVADRYRIEDLGIKENNDER